MTPLERKASAHRWVARLDDHEPGQARHAHRVAIYAVATGQRLGLREHELIDLRWAATLHDIGKLALPTEALRSPGPIDREMLPQHLEPPAGLDSWIAELWPIIAGHHWRNDGTGYPEGGTASLASQCIGVAEAFDVVVYGTVWRAAGGDIGLPGFQAPVVEALQAVACLIQPIRGA